MNPNIQDSIKQARDAGYTDEYIFNQIKSSPKYAEKYAQAEETGLNSKEVDKYLKQDLQLNVEQPKSFLQKAYGALSYNPVAELLEYGIGKNPVSENLKEISQSLGTALPAAFISLPNELAHLPGNIVEASKEHRQGEEVPYSEPFDKFVNGAMKGLDWAFEKTGLKKGSEIFPSFEEAVNALRPEENAPKTHLGKATERGTAGLLAGPVGVVGGIADYVGEQAGMSPEQRAIMSLMVAKVGKGPKAHPKTIYGELLPKEPIRNVNDLASRLISSNPENLNTQTLKAAYELSMPLENIPVQALYKNGVANLMEGISQNSFVGANRFNSLLENFTNEMTSRVDQVIDSMPIDTGLEEISTKGQIGEPEFVNTLPQLFIQAAPQLDIPKYQTGEIGTNALEAYDQDITQRYKDLYNQAEFMPNDLLRPSSSEYTNHEKIVKSVEKLLKSKGFKGAERKEGLRVLKAYKTLFAPKITIHPVTGKEIKTKPNIKLEDIRKNIQDFNKTISYEHPSLVNLMEPIASDLRSILDNAASNKPHLAPLLEANALFRQKAQFFNDPLIKKLLNMTGEQFYRAVRNNPSILRRFSEFANEVGQTEALNELKGRIMADVFEKALKAQSSKEMVSAINDKLIKEVRELEPFYPELAGVSRGLNQFRREHARHLTPQEQFKSKIRQKILEDIMSDSDFTDTLKIMNSLKGIDLVRETLRGTEQGRSLLKTLERKKVAECLYNGPQKQEITLAELAEVFENPKTDAILKKLLSDKNYQDAKSLSKIAEGFQEGKKSHKYVKKKFEKAAGLGAIGSLFLAPVSTVIGVGALSYFLTSKSFKAQLMKNTESQFNQSRKKQTPTTKKPKT